MNLIQSNQTADVQRFKELISLKQYAPKICLVSYMAAKQDDKKLIFSARIFIYNTKRSFEEIYVATTGLTAGRFDLSQTSLSIEQFIDKCCSGIFVTPQEEFEFWGQGERGTSIGVYFDPAHEVGSQEQRRISVLSLSGSQISNPRYDKGTQWELRAASTPFDSFDELSNELSLGGIAESNSIIEFVAYQPVAIAAENSRIKDNIASIIVHVADGLEVEKSSLGVRHLTSGVTKRYSMESSEFSWTKRDGFTEGRLEINVDEFDTLQCFAKYGEIVYSWYWVYDPERIQNVRYVSYSTFDESKSILRNNLLKFTSKKEKSKEFELSAAHLFWMLGFSVASLDIGIGLGECPDAIVTDTRGNLILLECTVGQINSNDKLSKLNERHVLLKRALASAGLGFIKSMPVLVTRLSREEAVGALGGAEELKILVLTREDLEDLLNQTTRQPNANMFFDVWVRRVEDAAQKLSHSSDLSPA